MVLILDGINYDSLIIKSSKSSQSLLLARSVTSEKIGFFLIIQIKKKNEYKSIATNC